MLLDFLVLFVDDFLDNVLDLGLLLLIELLQLSAQLLQLLKLFLLLQHTLVIRFLLLLLALLLRGWLHV